MGHRFSKETFDFDVSAFKNNLLHKNIKLPKIDWLKLVCAITRSKQEEWGVKKDQSPYKFYHDRKELKAKINPNINGTFVITITNVLGVILTTYILVKDSKTYNKYKIG